MRSGVAQLEGHSSGVERAVVRGGVYGGEFGELGGAEVVEVSPPPPLPPSSLLAHMQLPDASDHGREGGRERELADSQ